MFDVTDPTFLITFKKIIFLISYLFFRIYMKVLSIKLDFCFNLLPCLHHRKIYNYCLVIRITSPDPCKYIVLLLLNNKYESSLTFLI